MENGKTYSTSDLYEIAVYALAGVQPDAVEKITDHTGRYYGLAFYRNKPELPEKINMAVSWTDSSGVVHSAPLLSNFKTGEKSFAATHIEVKRKMFEIVDGGK